MSSNQLSRKREVVAWASLDFEKRWALLSEYFQGLRDVCLSLSEQEQAHRILSDWEALGIRFLCCHEPSYPSALRDLKLAPPALFFRGNTILSCNTKIFNFSQSISVVGSRKATICGVETAADFSNRLSSQGIVIVSGLALGIDAAAHRGALRSGVEASTCAVLAHGLDRVYPSAHRRLADEILESGGALISPYPPGVPPRPFRFLERNALIAALSKVTLVVEAAARSGALNTAGHAAELGREVGAIPGAINSEMHRGCNRLIQDGALLISDYQDLIELFEIDSSEKSPATSPIRAALVCLGGRANYEELEEALMLDLEDVETELLEAEIQGLISREVSGHYVLS